MHKSNVHEVSTTQVTEASSFPRITHLSFSHILTGLLVIISFILGSLYTKVQYLEKNGSNKVAAIQTAPQALAAAPNQAQPSTAPVVVQVDNGHFP